MWDELRAGYRILATCVAGCAVGMIGLSVYGLPFLAGPIAEEFGTAPTQVTTAASFLVAGIVLSGPLVGRLADRIGAKRIILASIVGYALTLLVISQFVGSLRWFYATYFALAALGAGTSYAVYARVVNGWFDRTRGLALGLMMSGPGISAAILPFLLPPIIAAYGWRGAYLSLALLAILAFPLILAFVRPRQVPIHGASDASVPNAMLEGMTIGQAIRMRQFWQMTIGVLCVSSAIIGTHLNFVAMLGVHGVTGRSVAIVASVYGGGSIAGRILVGVFLDRVHGGVIGCILFLLTALSMLIFQASDTWIVFVFAALALGMASGAEGDLTAYLASRYFGMKAFSEIYGWIYSAIALGLAAGAAIAGFVVRNTGGYDSWLFGSAVACILAAALFATLGPYPARLSAER